MSIAPPTSLISALGVKKSPLANVFSAISILIDATNRYSAACNQSAIARLRTWDRTACYNPTYHRVHVIILTPRYEWRHLLLGTFRMEALTARYTSYRDTYCQVRFVWGYLPQGICEDTDHEVQVRVLTTRYTWGHLPRGTCEDCWGR